MNGNPFQMLLKTGLRGLPELRHDESLAGKRAQRNHIIVTRIKRNPALPYPSTNRNPITGYAEKWLLTTGYAGTLIAQGCERCVTHVATVTPTNTNDPRISGGAQ